MEHARATVLGAVGVALTLAGCAGTGADCGNGALCGDQIDDDKDRNVTRSEWSDAFQRADANGDGSLSPDELDRGGWGRAGGRR